MHWITRAHPKIDRVACPWLITRFIDSEAVFHFAPASRVLEQANVLGATPFDIDGVVLSHRGDRCSFDAFLDDYQLTEPALRDLASIVRGADTDRLDLAPQAAGLLAISLGLSRLNQDDDQRMLLRGFLVYDALYEWLCHGKAERHGWNPGRVGGSEPAWTRLTDGDLEIDVTQHLVKVRGRRVNLRPKEFALAVAMVSRPGRVISRAFLLQQVWAYAPDVTSRTVDWHVAALRRRLGKVGDRIETIRGAGYRWHSPRDKPA